MDHDGYEGFNTSKQLEVLISIAKEHNLKKLRVMNIEFEFDAPKQQPIPAQEMMPKTLADQMPGDDEMLLYSTPHFDELRASREDALKPEGMS